MDFVTARITDSAAYISRETEIAYFLQILNPLYNSMV
jgi:hypothetical protein